MILEKSLRLLNLQFDMGKTAKNVYEDLISSIDRITTILSGVVTLFYNLRKIK